MIEDVSERGRLINPMGSAGPYTHEVVTSLLDPPNDLPVLDLGAGTGNFTAFLLDSGYRVVALDIDAEGYRNSGRSSAPFCEVDLDDELPVRPNTLGGVVAIEVLEHLENPLRLVRSVAASLVDNGWLIITTPNVTSLSSRLELLVRGHEWGFDELSYRTNGHISPVSLTQLERLASRCGLIIEAQTYNVGRLPIPRLRQRIQLPSRWGRSRLLGESLILKLRRRGDVPVTFVRG